MSVIVEQLKQSNTTERPHILTEHIRKTLAEFLEFDAISDIAENQNFVDLGVTSMEAVNYKILLEKDLQCALKTTLFFDYPSLDVLVNYLLTDVLKLTTHTSKQKKNTTKKTDLKPEDNQLIAIVAMDGIFPKAETPEQLWQNTIQPKTTNSNTSGINCNYLNPINYNNDYATLGITEDTYNALPKQQQLAYLTIARALKHYNITAEQLSKKKTAVFFASDFSANDDMVTNTYQVPLANAISFQLNLNGPSEMTNTFCTSAYVAIHRAIQSISANECEQALVGGVNLISRTRFEKAAQTGIYNDLLSASNTTQSFSTTANGFVRSEGAGVLVLKPLSKALEDNNAILAVIRSSAIAHGGRNFSLEAPKADAIKATATRAIEIANIPVDTIDYIEAHGIANPLADAIELTALHNSYSPFSENPNKKWHISTVKPTVGHPELVSGIASILKVIKAFEHNTIPGITNLDTVNTEIPDNHSLILQNNTTAWHTKNHPKRAGLNSYAIGGVNAHLILEEHTEKAISDNKTTMTKPQNEVIDVDKSSHSSEAINKAIDSALTTAFQLNLNDINRELSPIDYGFDSIKTVAFIRTINENLSINIKLGEALGCLNFNDLFTCISSKEHVSNHSVESQNTLTNSSTSEYPISVFQKGLWLSYKLNPEETTYNLPIVFSTTKAIKSHYALQALAVLLEKHPILRTYFKEDDTTITQKLHPISYCLTIDEAPLKTPPETTFKQLLRTPFNLEKDCLLRVYKRTSDTTNYLAFIIHHTILDGLSGTLFMRYFWEAYTSIENGDAPIVNTTDYQFFDYVNWEQHYLNSTQATTDLNWWLKQLNHLPTLQLPLDHSPNQFNSGNQHKNKQTLTLQGEALSTIKQTAKALNVSLSILLMACFKILLHRLSLQHDITVATPTEGRQKTTYTNSLGCFVNVVLIRSILNENHTLKQLIDTVKSNFLDGLNHSNYPLTNVLEALAKNQKESYTADNKIPVSFSYQNIFDSILDSNSVNTTATPLYDTYQETQDDYALEVYDFRTSLDIHIKYKSNLFESETIKKHLSYFKTILSQVQHNNTILLSELAIVSNTEQQQFLQYFDNTAVNYPKNKTIVDFFEEQVIRFPKRTAITFNDEHITYETLNKKVNQLAHYLKHKGLKKGDMAVLCLERSLDTVIVILAVAKVGATYVPVDTAYPLERISYTIVDTQSTYIICNTDLSNTLKKDFPSHTIINTVEEKIDINNSNTNNLQTPIQPQDNLYVIYTSGTTGKPKGVIVTHNNVVRLLKNDAPLFDFNEHDVWSLFHSYCFDFSVWELYGALLFGGRLVIVPNCVKKDALAFGELLEKEHITVLNQTPSAFYSLQEQLPQLAKQLAVRYVIFGGEALQPALLKAWHDTYKECQLINMYGITETTVHVTYQKITSKDIDNGISTIGAPIPTLSCYVIDKHLKLLPQGVPGELYVGGEGVAKGYLNRTDLTEERFITNPFKVNSRLYKTGDIVKWNYNNQLEYIGRTDEQVKIRGYRIELSEIEHTLLQHDKVSQCLVLAREVSKNNQQLIAYTVLNTTLEKEHLTAFLKQHLPEYMVPSAIIIVDEFPITANGKIDKKALPLPTNTLQYQFIAPRNETEEAIAKIFQEILEIDKIGIHDNFFELGGHSLLVIKVVKAINTQLNVKLTAQHIFKYPTVNDLALSIKNGTNNNTRVFLDKEIALNPKEHYPDKPFTFNSTPKHIFITGCTGFVGAYLLKELLDTTQAHLYCLTRAKNQEDAYKKIKDALITYNLWDDIYQTRVDALTGNLGQPLLGLPKNVFETLSQTVDVIYHNAAHMNHLATYDMLKADNVNGTLEIIKLACLHKTKAIHYTSTLAIFNNTARNRNKTITEQSKSTNEIHYDKDGYATSKWVGENIILEAQKHGVPCSIYRLGLTTGHSKTGQLDNKQWLYGFMKCCATMKAIINTDLDLELPMLPVDTVAKSLVDLAQQEHSINRVFHISGQPISLYTICKTYNETRNEPYPELSLHEWLQLSKLYDDMPIPPFIHHYLDLDAESLASSIEEELKAHIKITSHDTEKQLKNNLIKFNALSDESCKAYFKYMIKKEQLMPELLEIQSV